jgi:DNA primase
VQSQLYGETGVRASARETLIVLALISHPWLMEAYPEEIANLALRDPGLTKLRDAAMAIHAERSPLDSEGLRAQLNEQRFGDIVARVERAITHRSDGFADPEASREDVERGWRQILTLHRKSVELRQELEAAERALQAEGTEEAFERLRDIRLQLLNAEGMEASTDGFGSNADQPVKRAS